MVHRSHISSREAKLKGWSQVPSPAVREETKNLIKEVGIDYMSGEYLNLGAGSATTVSSTVFYPSTIAPLQTWGGIWYDPNYNQYYPQSQVNIQTIIQEKEVTKEVEKRTLFKVYVVDPRKNGKVLMDGRLVIALNENQAMLKAGVADVAGKENLELEQVDVYVQCIGTFIRPLKETQRVKIIREEE